MDCQLLCWVMLQVNEQKVCAAGCWGVTTGAAAAAAAA
jgi:hypothetical protein